MKRGKTSGQKTMRTQSDSDLRRICPICNSTDFERWEACTNSGKVGLSGTRCANCRNFPSYLIDMERIPVSFPKISESKLEAERKCRKKRV